MNVVAVTLLCEIDPIVEERVVMRLRDDPLIDAVLLWTPISQRRQFCLFYNDGNDPNWIWKKGILKTCIGRPSIEDCARVLFFKHPLIELNQQIHQGHK